MEDTFENQKVLKEINLVMEQAIKFDQVNRATLCMVSELLSSVITDGVSVLLALTCPSSPMQMYFYYLLPVAEKVLG